MALQEAMMHGQGASGRNVPPAKRFKGAAEKICSSCGKSSKDTTSPIRLGMQDRAEEHNSSICLLPASSAALVGGCLC
eukprot:2148328-Amphidinium_carterae.3